MAEQYRKRLEEGAARMVSDLTESKSWPVLNDDVRGPPKEGSVAYGGPGSTLSAREPGEPDGGSTGARAQKGVHIVYKAGSPADRNVATTVIDAPCRCHRSHA